MRRASSWRLSGRITRWCLAVGTGFVVLLAALGYLLVHLDTQEELDLIVEEELQELTYSFAALPGTRADFAASVKALEESHPDGRMAWRVWSRADGSIWDSFGPAELLEQVPPTAAESPALGAFMRWSKGALTSDLDVGLLLEGDREREYERRFAIVALSTIACAAGISFLAGRFLGLRIAGALRGISEQARASVRSAEFSPGASRLPEEMKEVVEALREAHGQIRGESDQARLLASGLAHELRSPLQNLLMQAEVALLREREPPEYRAALSKQILDLQELIRAVDNLVTLCAPPEARRILSGEVFDLAVEARVRLSREEARAAAEGIQVRALLPEALSFRGDREGLMLALRNLVANAIDWSPPEGRVEVRIEAAANGVVIQVDDQGPGVPESERERIFLPFERGSPPPNGRIGYGLGLALVRTVAELHQGTVRVTTSTLGGASFRLELPRPPGQ